MLGGRGVVRAVATIPFMFWRRFSRCPLLLVCLAATTSSHAAQQPGVSPQISEQVQSLITKFPGTVGIDAVNLKTGATFSFHADDPVPTASTIKLPIMIELFYEASEGRIDWNQKLQLTEAEKVSGSGVLTELTGGDELTIRDLMHLMIVVSDNTATNLLLERIGGEAVNRRMQRLGLHVTAVMHNIMEPRVDAGVSLTAEQVGMTAEGAKPGNQQWGTGRSCPREMVTLLTDLYRGTLVNRASSDEMLAVLRRQQFHDGIGRDMTGTPIASKSGALDHLRSDVAIVYSPGGPIAMAITVNNIPQVNYGVDNPGDLLISSLSEVLVRDLSASAAP
jgi:beta-lactamase class A